MPARTIPLFAWLFLVLPGAGMAAIDFNRDIRPILSNNCFLCHGPDGAERKADLRLDLREGATAAQEGGAAIVPGHPEESEALRRILTEDAEDRMPPAKTGKQLSDGEKALVEQWIREGAPYAAHWSYVPPRRPAVPGAGDGWARNPVDAFVLERLAREGLEPSAEADRAVLARRVALDLTGLPPEPSEVERLVADDDPRAYERFVDRLLARPGYGEHWARMWLDLARYADSSGYADDPARTIWAYRDWVIRAFNSNQPFDRFTVDQLAGDLLPEAAEEQLIATAFHRNTQTNNEGGTNDEEYRNVAVVDRVNTTMSVWMGTTMACAQCHSHKYDPISQHDYFRLFAVLNNTADADRGDESPTIGIFTREQRRMEEDWRRQIAELEAGLRRERPELERGQERWEAAVRAGHPWEVLDQASATVDEGPELTVSGDGWVEWKAESGSAPVYRLRAPVPGRPVTAIRLEIASGGAGESGLVVAGVTAAHEPRGGAGPAARFVRVELAGGRRILSLAEVQVLEGEANLALQGAASQSSTGFGGPAARAIDGNTDGNFQTGSTTHTEIQDDPWWEVDLGSERRIDRVVLWNRTDGGEGIGARLAGFRLVLLDAERKPVFEQESPAAPAPSAEVSIDGRVPVRFGGAWSTATRAGLDAAWALENPDPAAKGWAPAEGAGELMLGLLEPARFEEGFLTLRVETRAAAQGAAGRLRLAFTSEPVDPLAAATPSAVRVLAQLPSGDRSAAQQAELDAYYRSVAPELAAERRQLAELRQRLENLKPETTVPVLRELPEGERRVTRLQHRGNFLDVGEEVEEGLPESFPQVPGPGRADRLRLARWLVSPENPLTARVTVNRYWEKLFGAGLVLTSEEFGSQGEPPTHPELLDWLAVELVESGWDLKALIRLLVTSATYRQTSKVDAEMREADPANRWLARGPRQRLTAETIRDQALAAGGLLSAKMFGAPVRPPQPSMGLSAAFGGGIDWQTSEGEDRYRRGLYTTWRRSNPYPSMATFDAPNREVCTVRRERTNTPLQALVTLNDPVFIEAAQGLARRMARVPGGPAEKARHGFRICLSRDPGEAETGALVRLHADVRARYESDPSLAASMAADPLGPMPAGTDAADLAAWTVVGNVLLNLDEFLMRP